MFTMVLGSVKLLLKILRTWSIGENRSRVMLMAAGRKMIYSHASIFVEACTAALKVQTELGLVFTYFGVLVHLDRTQKHLKLFLFFGVEIRVCHVS